MRIINEVRRFGPREITTETDSSSGIILWIIKKENFRLDAKAIKFSIHLSGKNLKWHFRVSLFQFN